MRSVGCSHRTPFHPQDSSDGAEIKITDFGLSKIFTDDLAGEVRRNLNTKTSTSSQPILVLVPVLVLVLIRNEYLAGRDEDEY